MAKLSRTEVIQRILTPKNKSNIDYAVLQAERLLMHCEPILEKYNLPFNALRNFTNWWQSLITKEKYTRIESLLGTPLSTLSTTKDIFDQLGKFIDAQDRYVDFNFTSIDYTNDYNSYLERINDDSFWRQRAVSALSTDICSMVVIDCPSNQITDRPEPYKYFVSPSMAIDIDINRYTGNVEYFIFRQSSINWDGDLITSSINDNRLNLLQKGATMDKVIAIDDNYYRVYVKAPNAPDKDFLLVSEEKHNLGYCPVIDFWQPSIKGTNGINKRGPITNVLKKLDYLLFYQALADYMDLYGPFPILVTYDMEEIYWDDKTKETNTGQNGFDSSQISTVSNTEPVQNPATSDRSKIGPGSELSVPVPADKNDHDFMKKPMEFVGMKVDSLEYVQDKIKSLKCEIIEICTGEDKEYQNEMNKNEQMESSAYEVKETIFTLIKRQFERVHRFSTKTQAILRYGKGYFISCTIDYGSDFFLKDASTLSKEFKEAVDNGMPIGYSMEIAYTATKTRFKNNPDILARMRIYYDLEPYQGIDWETLQLLEIDKCDKIGFIIKANFSTFVRMFELETKQSIVMFGSLIDYSKKISIIQTKFKDYASKIKWTEPADKPAISGNKSGTRVSKGTKPKKS